MLPTWIVKLAVPVFTLLSSWQPAVEQVGSPGAPVCEAGAPELDFSGIIAIIATEVATKTDTIRCLDFNIFYVLYGRLIRMYVNIIVICK